MNAPVPPAVETPPPPAPASTPAAAPPPAARREDILVSVAFSDAPATEEAFATIAGVAAEIDRLYRYHEILVITEAAAADSYAPLLERVPNLRLIKVRHGVQFYQKRVVAALEAIGDIVLLTTVEEAPGLDLPAFLDLARSEEVIVTAEREQSSLLNPLIRTLGHAGGFRVSTRQMLTAAYPRALLSVLMGYPDRQLTLRFPPRDPGIPLRRLPARNGTPAPRSVLETARRLGLIQRLMMSSAPLVLRFVALLSVGVAVSALFYAAYVVVVVLTVSNLQPGWVTLSTVLSLTALFLGVSIFALSSGLQKLIEIASPDIADDVVGELGKADLFSQITDELNIEIETGDGRRPPDESGA